MLSINLDILKTISLTLGTIMGVLCFFSWRSFRNITLFFGLSLSFCVSLLYVLPQFIYTSHSDDNVVDKYQLLIYALIFFINLGTTFIVFKNLRIFIPRFAQRRLRTTAKRLNMILNFLAILSVLFFITILFISLYSNAIPGRGTKDNFLMDSYNIPLQLFSISTLVIVGYWFRRIEKDLLNVFTIKWLSIAFFLWAGAHFLDACLSYFIGRTDEVRHIYYFITIPSKLLMIFGLFRLVISQLEKDREELKLESDLRICLDYIFAQGIAPLDRLNSANQASVDPRISRLQMLFWTVKENYNQILGFSRNELLDDRRAYWYSINYMVDSCVFDLSKSKDINPQRFLMNFKLSIETGVHIKFGNFKKCLNPILLSYQWEANDQKKNVFIYIVDANITKLNIVRNTNSSISPLLIIGLYSNSTGFKEIDDILKKSTQSVKINEGLSKFVINKSIIQSELLDIGIECLTLDRYGISILHFLNQ